MKQYKKTIDGKTVIRPRNKIVVVKDGRQYINPREEMVIEDGWEEYNIPTPSETEVQSRQAMSALRNSDYKVIKCIEAFLCGEEMPYDIHELHRERNEHRERVRRNER